MKIAKLINFQEDEVQIIEGVAEKYGLSFTAAIGFIIRQWQEQVKLQQAINRSYGIKDKED